MPTISDAQALAILRESNNKTYDAQSHATSAAMGAQVAAKQQNAVATKNQVKGDQFASVSKMATGGMGMLLNTKLNIRANRDLTPAEKALPADEQGKLRANRAGLNSATQGGAIGQAINSAGDAADQLVGGAHMSAQAKIDGKGAEIADTIAGQQVEGAKSQKEKAMKGIDSAEEFGKGLFDRAKSVVDRMFGG